MTVSLTWFLWLGFLGFTSRSLAICVAARVHIVIVVPSSADLDAALSLSPPESEPPQPTTSARAAAAARVRSGNRRREQRSSDLITHLLLAVVGRGKPPRATTHPWCAMLALTCIGSSRRPATRHETIGLCRQACERCQAHSEVGIHTRIGPSPRLPHRAYGTADSRSSPTAGVADPA